MPKPNSGTEGVLVIDLLNQGGSIYDDPDWTYGEHVVCWVHLGLGLPGNDCHDVDLVSVALFQAAGQDVVVALGGAVQGELVPGIQNIELVSKFFTHEK